MKTCRRPLELVTSFSHCRQSLEHISSFTWCRATSVTQTLFCLSTVIMWGRKKRPAPQELTVCPLALTVSTVACGMGTLLSSP